MTSKDPFDEGRLFLSELFFSCCCLLLSVSDRRCTVLLAPAAHAQMHFPCRIAIRPMLPVLPSALYRFPLLMRPAFPQRHTPQTDSTYFYVCPVPYEPCLSSYYPSVQIKCNKPRVRASKFFSCNTSFPEWFVTAVSVEIYLPKVKLLSIKLTKNIFRWPVPYVHAPQAENSHHHWAIPGGDVVRAC